MTCLNTSLIRKLTLFLAAAMLSASAMSADINSIQSLANQGDVKAQNFLGLLYLIGEGVPQDDAKAIQWYEKSANQGDVKAQNFLGKAHYDGQIVRQNYANAFQWYEKSANQGNVYGQSNLGLMYYNGQGVRQDYGNAKRWYSRAFIKVVQ